MRRPIAASAALFAFAFAQQAFAQDWPQRPVTFIVSQSAGASPDVMARMIANKLSVALGQSFVIENKPGAGNVIGAQAAARSAPDGYTFFFATSAALVTNPYMVKNLSYDPVKDFAPVALVTKSHQIVVVHPDVPAKTLAELIALDKAAPGKISMSVDGPRNLAGVTAQALNKRAGTKFVLIPSVNINSGLQDTIAGRTQAGVFSASILESHLRSGALARARDRLDPQAFGRARHSGGGGDAAGLRLFRLVHGDGAGGNAAGYHQASSTPPLTRRPAIRRCVTSRPSSASNSTRRASAAPNRRPNS